MKKSKKLMSYKEMVKRKRKNTTKGAMAVYFILRGFVVFTLVRSLFEQEYFNVLLCVLSLFLFTIPTFIEEGLRIELPDTLEVIVYMFIFAAEILGEINNFYILIPNWDTVLHTLNGFLCAAVGFSLVDLLNRNSSRISLSPLYMSLVAFCFSMTVGVLWEFFEYSADHFLHTDMQKDTVITDIYTVELNPDGLNEVVAVEDIETTTIVTEDGEVIEIEGYLDIGLNDTMEDLFVNLVGASVFSVFGFFYVKHRTKKGQFVENFIPRRMDDEK